MRLNKNDRHQWILKELTHSPSLRIVDLAERLNVATETIRRDLQELTDGGLVVRTYGGAIKPPTTEPDVNLRHALFVAEREAIARAAIEVIRQSKTLYIGSGATTTCVARRIAAELNGITILTHALGVATALAENPTLRIMLLPGYYSASEDAVYGAPCLRYIEEIQADFVILSASGLLVEGPNELLPEIAEVYRKMIRHSQNRLMVADHSKFDRQFVARFAVWREIDVLVTDQPVPPLMKAEIDRAGTTVVTVDVPRRERS